MARELVNEKEVKTLHNVVIQLRNDTAANWGTSEYILAKGELGLDTTNNVIKIGDGVSLFTALPNAGSVIAEAGAYDATTNPGGKDAEHGGIKVNGSDINVYTLNAASASMLGGVKSATLVDGKYNTAAEGETANYVSGYVTVDANGLMTVAIAPKADQLSTARDFSITGDDISATAVSFNGTADVALAAVLSDSGVTANNTAQSAPYTGVKVDAKGRVKEGITAASMIASGKNTGAASQSSTLGFVQSDYDADKLANSDDNKGKVAIDASGNMTVTRVDEADKLHTARTIAFADATGGGATTDVSGSFSFDGSADVTAQLTLADKFTFDSTESAAGYKRVTVAQVNSKGLVTGTENLVSADVTDAVNASTGSTDAAKVIKTDAQGKLSDSFLNAVTRTDAAAANTATEVITGITTDAQGRVTGTAKMEATDVGGTANDSGKLVKLNANGKLSNAIIPNLAIGEISAVAALSEITRAESGDMAIVTAVQDTANNETAEAFKARQVNDGVYVYVGNTSGDETYSVNNWILVKTPGTSIQSVNGQTGPTVNLSTDDITEGSTNKYFTNARVYSAIHAINTRDADNSFADAAHIVLDTDTFIINCGTATSGTQGA